MAIDDVSIPEGMSALLDIFASELAELRFGDLDRGALERAADAVRVAAGDLAEAEAAAEAARTALEAAREELLQKGQRALAYARIYAEGAPEIAQRLQAITFVRGTRRTEVTSTSVGPADGAPRRRGRPPKVNSEVTGTLALGAAGADDGAPAPATPVVVATAAAGR